MQLSFNPACTSALNAKVWHTYLDLEPHHLAGGLSLFEAVANRLNMTIDAVVDIVYYCGNCAQRRQCQAGQAPLSN